jgi:hypothetical protein
VCHLSIAIETDWDTQYILFCLVPPRSDFHWASWPVVCTEWAVLGQIEINYINFNNWQNKIYWECIISGIHNISILPITDWCWHSVLHHQNRVSSNFLWLLKLYIDHNMSQWSQNLKSSFQSPTTTFWRSSPSFMNGGQQAIIRGSWVCLSAFEFSIGLYISTAQIGYVRKSRYAI